jgi:hypothetical protein
MMLGLSSRFYPETLAGSCKAVTVATPLLSLIWAATRSFTRTPLMAVTLPENEVEPVTRAVTD